jgi:hypothetical protein
MGEVIYGVNFGKVVRVDFDRKNTTISITQYLDKLAETGVCEEDILDIRDAIQDVEAFKQADEVVQTFASKFFSDAGVM